MHKRPVRLVIIDDDNYCATATRLLLRRDASIQLAGIATSATEGRAVIREHQPDVALVDWMLGDGDGLKLIAELGRDLPKIRWILVTAYASLTAVEFADKAGASGVLDKLQLSLDVLRRAILSVAAGAQFYCDSIQELRRRGRVNPLPVLSHRQQQILERLSAYEARSDIARSLAVTPATVTQHLCRIARKLGVARTATTAELLSAARGAGLLPRIPSRGSDAR